ncbi:MerR family transcriptional regulator [Clostridia bacterium]|nr:MerR family transcriptional regulator [Clostridia bacterium]
MSKYTTGEAAKLCGVSVRTIQFYDTKGLRHPTELTDGGRRLYSDADVTQLRLICMLKSLGLSLDSIQEILNSGTSSKVLLLLLDEQAKRLNDEIKERQNQLGAIKVVRENVRDMAAIPVNSIIDIDHMMKNKKRLKKVYGTMIAIVLAMFAIAITAAIVQIKFGVWISFAIGMPLIILCVVWLVSYYYKNTAYICAECGQTFRPKVGEFMFANHTPKTRKLTCPHCGKKDWCVETYGAKEK